MRFIRWKESARSRSPRRAGELEYAERSYRAKAHIACYPDSLAVVQEYEIGAQGGRQRERRLFAIIQLFERMVEWTGWRCTQFQPCRRSLYPIPHHLWSFAKG